MKVLVMLVMLVYGNALKAESINHEELFSPVVNAKVLGAVDFICGDIWCEGYYDYKFLGFSCDKNSRQCDLSFQFKESYDDQVVKFSPVQVCRVSEIGSLEQILYENSDVLKYEFINKLSDCFADLAEKFREN